MHIDNLAITDFVHRATLKLFDYLGAVLYQYHNKVLKINVNQLTISETTCNCDSSIIYDNHFHIVVHSFKGNNQHYIYTCWG